MWAEADSLIDPIVESLAAALDVKLDRIARQIVRWRAKRHEVLPVIEAMFEKADQMGPEELLFAYELRYSEFCDIDDIIESLERGE